MHPGDGAPSIVYPLAANLSPRIVRVRHVHNVTRQTACMCSAMRAEC
jgi:hypothetical protein